MTIKGKICAITPPKAKAIGLYMELRVLCLLHGAFLGFCSPVWPLAEHLLPAWPL